MHENQSSMRAALQAAFEHGLRYRMADDSAPVAALADHATLLSRLQVPLADAGIPAATVVDDLVHAVQGGLAGITGPRFFGWVNGGSLPAALAADWLTSAWDQNAGLFVVSPASTVVEEVAGKWLKELLRLPPESSFGLVTGCQMAHVTCLAAARHGVLASHGYDVERNGLFGAPQLRILTSTEVHGSVLRAARLLGVGERNVQQLAVDSSGRLPESTLRTALEAAHAAPIIVVLQAGDLNIGAFDDYERLIPIAKQFNAWVHVDGAFGLWLQASPRLRSLVRGVEQADSWATDGHKWLNVPYDCGYAFVRHPASHHAAFAHHAPYISADDQAREPLHWTPEFSRRARGFSTYAAIRELGRSGVADLIERCCDHAHALVMGIGSLSGAEVLAEPQINQGLVRFLHPSPHATGADHDHFTDEVTAGILRSGEALFSNTTWRGRRAMRVSVCNWQTSSSDVERVIHAVADVLARARTATSVPLLA